MKDSEAQATGDEDGPQWSSWDTRKAVSVLKTSTDPELRKRILRKLHVKMWHATPNQMKQILMTASTNPSLMEAYKVICDTCRVCRPWVRPGARPLAAARLAAEFNQHVEVDLFFFGRSTQSST